MRRPHSGRAARRRPRTESKQFAELFPGDAGLADKGAERAFGQLAMIGNSQTPTRWMPQDDVAASLVVHFVTEFSESFDRVCTGTDRQAVHTGTSTISSVMPPGIGSPCFLRLARYPWMASRMWAIASSRVLPWEMHPGRAGHSATNTPSSSGSMVTRNFMPLRYSWKARFAM